MTFSVWETLLKSHFSFFMAILTQLWLSRLKKKNRKCWNVIQFTLIITQSEYDLEIFMLVFFFYNEPYNMWRVWLKTGFLINARTQSKKMISILDNSSLDWSLNFSSFTWKHRMMFSSTKILIRQINLWHCMFLAWSNIK